MNNSMRTVFLFVLLLHCAWSEAQNQVQRTFMGCKFGEKKEVVLDSLKAKGIKVVSGKDVVVIEGEENPIHYNGVPWSYVCLHFFDNQFYTISFTSDDTQRKRADMKADYGAMRCGFEKLFRDNMLYDLDEGLRVHDGHTGIYCHIDCVDGEGNRTQPSSGTMRLFLTYTDEKIDQVRRVLED